MIAANEDKHAIAVAQRDECDSMAAIFADDFSLLGSGNSNGNGNGGLDQAGIALLSDDSLAHVLSYLATSKEEIEDVICVALPIFKEASKSNAVWKQLCRRRWSEKWGFRKRLEDAINDFQTVQRLPGQQQQQQQQQQQHQSTTIDNYWKQAYCNAEQDSTRSTLTRSELCSLKFDIRQWFSFSAFRNQPENMRDLLPTGLKTPFARDMAFTTEGLVQSAERNWLASLRWESSNNEAFVSGQEGLEEEDEEEEEEEEESTTMIREVGLKRNRSSVECLFVRRVDDWGWELRGSDYILRAVDDDWEDSDKLFEDLTSKIVVQDRPDWAVPQRGPSPYNYREVPDNDDCQMMLDW